MTHFKFGEDYNPILFFSGRFHADKDGNLYLASIDPIGENPNVMVTTLARGQTQFMNDWLIYKQTGLLIRRT